MSSANKVLGAIGAMQTLIENFPMSLFDLLKGKTYTSVFEFIIDILKICGVDTNKIMEIILREVYAIEADLSNGSEILQQLIVTRGADIDEQQSKFLKAMEDSIKVILMGLLTSVFTCAAVPVIPNKYMDRPRRKSFGKDNGEDENPQGAKDLIGMWELGEYPANLAIPINYIDPMGIFEIAPTSTNGRLYYNTAGGDKYYKKVLDSEEYYGSSFYAKRNKIVKLYLDFSDKKEIVFKLNEPILDNINISVGYISHDNPNLCLWATSIKMGETASLNGLKINPKGKNGNTSVIKWISINGQENEFILNDGKIIQLSYELSSMVINYWNSRGAYSLDENIKWSDKIRSEVLLGTGDDDYNNDGSGEGDYGDDEYDEPQIQYTYRYVEEKYNKKYLNATRYQSVPTSPGETSPDYIVVYAGENPNELYMSYDMNAFLWYCIKKGTIIPQTELNHMMWDSRLSAKRKHGISGPLNTWKGWYNSKTETEYEFFEGTNVPVKKSSPFYPILQVSPVRSGSYFINVSFPAQRYFKPKLREKYINAADGETITKSFTFASNASIYRFDWEYLQSIQILKPRQMLAGLCRYLLGFAYDTASSTNINFTQKLIEKKLATAIKNIVEADDMEVEDCYTSFSNEDFNAMMEEMNLSRYNATYNSNGTSTTRVHDVKDYINQINNINSNATQEGSITSIKKLVTDVTTTPSEGDYEIAYGIEATTDGNLLAKLIWAIVMPIAESLFSPQVMLLIMINFGMMGIVKLDEVLTADVDMIFNLLLNKILSILKAIIKFIKDMIIELLLRFVYEIILPLIIKYILIVYLEQLNDWLLILKAALSCIPVFKFTRTKMLNAIDEVDYADIINDQNTPESTATC